MKLASLAASLFALSSLVACTGEVVPDSQDPQDDQMDQMDPGSPALSACGAGFENAGTACNDVDECKSPSACGAESSCNNLDGSFECLPMSCAAVLAADPTATDGEYRLFADGDVAKPWKAYCADMATSAPKEYLTLVNIDGNFNYGEYTAGGPSFGTSVRTSFHRVRIDPFRLEVDTSDLRFSLSSGLLFHVGGAAVSFMPFGVAMSCGPTGTANIDLSGLPFGIASAWAQGGASPFGAAAMGTDNRTASITGGGGCGWNGPIGTGYNPFNPSGSTPVLQLAYSK